MKVFLFVSFSTKSMLWASFNGILFDFFLMGVVELKKMIMIIITGIGISTCFFFFLNLSCFFFYFLSREPEDFERHIAVKKKNKNSGRNVI